MRFVKGARFCQGGRPRPPLNEALLLRGGGGGLMKLQCPCVPMCYQLNISRVRKCCKIHQNPVASKKK